MPDKVGINANPCSGDRGWKPLIKRFLEATAFYLYNHLVTHIPVYALRHAYLRRVLGMSIGKGAAIHMGCFFTGRRIRVGDRTVVNRRCYLDGRGGLFIGDDVSISPEAYILSLTHAPDARDFAAVPREVSIADRAWIGARALILPGVAMGEGSVAGAGAVVTKPVEPYHIVAGSPARKIGERSRGLDYRLGYFPLYDTDIRL